MVNWVIINWEGRECSSFAQPRICDQDPPMCKVAIHICKLKLKEWMHKDFLLTGQRCHNQGMESVS